MYIVPTGGVFEQIGFVSSADDLPADAVETGFAWFGTQVAYAANESDYELMFWANGTDDEAIWSLVWSSPDTDKPNGSFPGVSHFVFPPRLAVCSACWVYNPCLELLAPGAHF